MRGMSVSLDNSETQRKRQKKKKKETELERKLYELCTGERTCLCSVHTFPTMLAPNQFRRLTASAWDALLAILVRCDVPWTEISLLVYSVPPEPHCSATACFCSSLRARRRASLLGCLMFCVRKYVPVG